MVINNYKQKKHINANLQNELPNGRLKNDYIALPSRKIIKI
jgi:hypothetical protein